MPTRRAGCVGSVSVLGQRAATVPVDDSLLPDRVGKADHPAVGRGPLADLVSGGGEVGDGHRTGTRQRPPAITVIPEARV